MRCLAWIQVPELFGRRPPDRTPRRCRQPRPLGKAEVPELHVPVAGRVRMDEEIRRLHVAVDDVVGVHELERHTNLPIAGGKGVA